jgi:hypothetical protein
MCKKRGGVRAVGLVIPILAVPLDMIAAATMATGKAAPIAALSGLLATYIPALPLLWASLLQEKLRHTLCRTGCPVGALALMRIKTTTNMRMASTAVTTVCSLFSDNMLPGVLVEIIIM